MTVYDFVASELKRRGLVLHASEEEALEVAADLRAAGLDQEGAVDVLADIASHESHDP